MQPLFRRFSPGPRPNVVESWPLDGGPFHGARISGVSRGGLGPPTITLRSGPDLAIYQRVTDGAMAYRFVGWVSTFGETEESRPALDDIKTSWSSLKNQAASLRRGGPAEPSEP